MPENKYLFFGPFFPEASLSRSLSHLLPTTAFSRTRADSRCVADSPRRSRRKRAWCFLNVIFRMSYLVGK